MFKWKMYNWAIIPDMPPHISPTDEDVKSAIDKFRNYLFIRYTTQFDCGYDTDWFFCIKDTPYDLSSVKAKRRYEINKGLKNFDVKKIKPSLYKEELYQIQIEAFSVYPEKYRPVVNKDEFFKVISTYDGDDFVVYGAFNKENDELCGYAQIKKMEGYYAFNVLKTKPSAERIGGLNAAIVYKLLIDLQKDIEDGYYICDGEKSIFHETNFQSYLEKYFGFRKAFCKLNVLYDKRIKWFVKTIYPFRKILKKMSNIKFVNKINSVLKMEEIVRKQNKSEFLKIEGNE